MKFSRVAFWTDPKNAPDFLKRESFYKYCLPEFYLHLQGFTNIINSAIFKYVEKEWSILDIGCGTGRGLADLYQKGYQKIAGVEINSHAIELGRETYKELDKILIICSPIEELVKHISLDYDVIYSVGTLMHLPYEYDNVIKLIGRSAKRLIITAENEREVNTLKYPRNYRDHFERLGWQQIEEESGDKYPPISKSTIKRVFIKER